MDEITIDEWLDQRLDGWTREEKLNCMFSESGESRELYFDLEQAQEREFNKWLEKDK